ncbi:MAG: carbamoyltransferase N-terminal domain-containing protein, partial [Patescibacteria group bacterium]
MKILGIYFGHNATVGLMQNGKVIFCQSEERFNRLKNSTGFPEKTLAYIYKTYGKDIDYVVFPQATSAGYLYLKRDSFRSIRYQSYFSKTRFFTPVFLFKFLLAKYLPRLYAHFLRYKTQRYDAYVAKNKNLRKEAFSYFSKATGLSEEKIILMDHHQSHAFSVLSNLDKDKKTLIFTLDGEGDDACGSVSIAENGYIKEISRMSKFNSIGYIYLEITGLLGMKPNEDEFKVMGLAPYAKLGSDQVQEVYDEFRRIFRLNERLEFELDIPPGMLRYYFLDKFGYSRFDHLAAGLQRFLEDMVEEWVTAWVKKTGITDIAASGGVFMNVKMNQRIAELDCVTD